MGLLQGFEEKDFQEQIAVLGEVKQGVDSSDFDKLFELYVQPAQDPAVRTMLGSTLRFLLLRNEEEILKGMRSGNASVRQLCMGLAGHKKLKAAEPLLLDLVKEFESDADVLVDVLSVMGRIQAEAFLEIFQKYLDHGDPLVKSLCFSMVGEYQDASSLGVLMEQVERNAAPENFEICELATWKALEALGKMRSPEVLEFLTDVIHHANPTARRMVHRTLESVGVDVVPYLAKPLRTGTADEKIMAANVLGLVGDKKGSTLLTQAVDEGRLATSNQMFAVYEALGRITSLTSLIFLLDALKKEQDEIMLMCVVEAVEKQVNEAAASKLLIFFQEGLQDPNSRQVNILSMIVAGKALNFFEYLYEYEDVAKVLVSKIAETADPEVLDVFVRKLNTMKSDRAQSDAEKLASREGFDTRGHILVIDDSVAMLSFYRTAASEMGFGVTCAENGQLGLDVLEEGVELDLIVVDMNMPVMDGIEFTGKVRTMEKYHGIPIIMATTESAKSQAQLAKKAGVSTFFKKPFTVGTLQHKIKKILQ